MLTLETIARKLYRAVSLVPNISLLRDLSEYNKKNKQFEKFHPRIRNLLFIDEKDKNAGQASGAYFFQDLWAAKRIYQENPKRHVDIGSRIDGFIAHCLTFRDVDVVDIRKLDSTVDGLCFIQDDATSLSRFQNNSLESVSTLHAAEHFGLGRYGDDIDPSAYIKFAKALECKLAPGGRLYYSVPCGKERLCFNAHRIFSPYTILELFKELKLIELSGTLDDGNYYKNIDIATLSKQNEGCGFFEFTKE